MDTKQVVGQLSFLMVGLFLAGLAQAECSEARIKRLYKESATIHAIARTCDMTKAEIQEVVGTRAQPRDTDDEGETGEDEETEAKLPRGAALGACGCWGPIQASARRPAPECKSGTARPRACPGWCAPGASQWRDTCA